MNYNDFLSLAHFKVQIQNFLKIKMLQSHDEVVLIVAKEP